MQRMNRNRFRFVVLNQIENSVGDEDRLKGGERNCMRTIFNEKLVLFNSGELTERIEAKRMKSELVGIIFEL
jgi:hypothetical protein